MAPAYAIPRLLARHGLALADVDLWEIHEAFAAQVLCNVAALEDEAFVREKAGVAASLGKFPWERFNPTAAASPSATRSGPRAHASSRRR